MEEPSTLRPLTRSQREELEQATAAFQRSVTPAVAGWLLARGIERADALTARLGFVAEEVPGYGQYLGNLAIPYLAADGHPVQLRFRCLGDHNCRELGHGKYRTMAGDPARIYNVGAIHRADDVIHIAEGELDAVILNRIGLPAVAVPGANNWKPHHRRMFAGFSEVLVWADPDEAGAEMARKITRSLTSARKVRLTRGDVTDTFKAGGAEALLAALERSVQVDP